MKKKVAQVLIESGHDPTRRNKRHQRRAQATSNQRPPNQVPKNADLAPDIGAERLKIAPQYPIQTIQPIEPQTDPMTLRALKALDLVQQDSTRSPQEIWAAANEAAGMSKRGPTQTG